MLPTSLLLVGVASLVLVACGGSTVVDSGKTGTAGAGNAPANGSGGVFTAGTVSTDCLGLSCGDLCGVCSPAAQCKQGVTRCDATGRCVAPQPGAPTPVCGGSGAGSGAMGSGGTSSCAGVACAPCPPGSTPQASPPGSCCAQCLPDKCATVDCALLTCAPGTSPVTVAGECCPTCLPTDCSSIVCAMGPCVAGTVSQTLPGNCCPSCVPEPGLQPCQGKACGEGCSTYVPPGSGMPSQSGFCDPQGSCTVIAADCPVPNPACSTVLCGEQSATCAGGNVCDASFQCVAVPFGVGISCSTTMTCGMGSTCPGSVTCGTRGKPAVSYSCVNGSCMKTITDCPIPL